MRTYYRENDLVNILEDRSEHNDFGRLVHVPAGEIGTVIVGFRDDCPPPVEDVDYPISYDVEFVQPNDKGVRTRVVIMSLPDTILQPWDGVPVP